MEIISSILQLLRATSNAQLLLTVSWSGSVSSVTLANHTIIPDCSSIASALIEVASPSKQFFVSRLVYSTYSDDILDYTRGQICSYLTHFSVCKADEGWHLQPCSSFLQCNVWSRPLHRNLAFLSTDAKPILITFISSFLLIPLIHTDSPLKSIRRRIKNRLQEKNMPSGSYVNFILLNL